MFEPLALVRVAAAVRSHVHHHPTYSASAGLVLAALIGAVACLLSLRLIARAHRLSTILAVPVAAAAFSASFAVLNPALQPDAWSAAWLHAEITTGVLPVRVTAAWFGARFLITLLTAARQADPEFTYPEYYLDPDSYEREWQRSAGWTPEQIAGEFAVFEIALTVLCVYEAARLTSTLIALLNWLTAFTVSQYAAAATVRLEQGVSPNKLQAFNLELMTLAIGGLMSFSLWQSVSSVVAALGTLLVISLLMVGFGHDLAVTGSAILTTVGIDSTPDEYYTALDVAKKVKAELVELLSGARTGSSAVSADYDAPALADEVTGAVIEFAAIPESVSDPSASGSLSDHIVAVLMHAPLAATRLDRALGTASAIQILEEHGFPDDVADSAGAEAAAAVGRAVFAVDG